MLSFAKRDVFEGSCENLTDFMVEPVCAKHLTKKLFVCESCRDQGVGSPDPVMMTSGKLTRAWCSWLKVLLQTDLHPRSLHGEPRQVYSVTGRSALSRPTSGWSQTPMPGVAVFFLMCVGPVLQVLVVLWRVQRLRVDTHASTHANTDTQTPFSRAINSQSTVDCLERGRQFQLAWGCQTMGETVGQYARLSDHLRGSHVVSVILSHAIICPKVVLLLHLSAGLATGS